MRNFVGFGEKITSFTVANEDCKNVLIMKKWLFFDIDDTLWDFSNNSEIALECLYDESEMLKHRFCKFQRFADVYHDVNSEMWRRYSKGEISSDFLKTERFRQFLFPDSYSEESLAVCRSLNDRYLHILCHIPKELDGGSEVLSLLSKNYLIGGVTNGFTDTQYTKIYTTGLWRYIQRMIISDEIGIQKPDKRFFDYALESTGALREESVVIGDNPSTDVCGALEAGIDAVFFNPYNKDASELKEYWKEPVGKGRLLGEIESLRELPTLLANLRQ